jgi:putative heme-binding domain-containing protein
MLFTQMARSPAFRASEPGASFLEQLAGIVGARNRPNEVARMLEFLPAESEDPSFVRRALLALGRGMSRSGGHFALSGLSPAPANRLIAETLDRAVREAANEQAAEAARLQAIAILGCAPLERSRKVLANLLDPRHPQTLQLASLHALAGYSEPEVASLVLERDRSLVPAVRAEAIDTLLAREPWTLALLRAAKEGRADVSQVDPARRTLLTKHRNSDIAALARQVFSRAAPTSLPGPDVLAAFAPALKLTGDARRGSEVFGKQCATCHRLGDRGYSVGPDLSATQFREPDALMTHIIEPNRFIAPNYVQYLVSDRSGRIFTGLIASETPSSLTLRRAEGIEDTILRSQIEELANTGKSLMPENFAAKLTHQEMADLLAYILSVHRGTPESGRLDIGTEAGAIEPER